MNFLQLQEDLHKVTKDRRNEWSPDVDGDDSKGSSLKDAVYHGMKQVHRRLMQNSGYKDQNYTSLKLNPVEGKASLPDDFDTEYEMLDASGVDFYEYRIDKKTKKIVFSDSKYSREVEFRYIVKEPEPSDNDDEINIEEHFHDAITIYAMEKYHLDQLDWDNVGRSVAYGDDKMEELILNYF